MREGRVLYPTDFSVNSIMGIDGAMDYCASLNKELIILYTYRLISSDNGSSSYSLKKNLDTEASRIFDQIEKEKLSGRGVSYQLLSEVGFVDDRISHHVEQDEFDQIILCKSLRDILSAKIKKDDNGDKSLFELPVLEV